MTNKMPEVGDRYLDSETGIVIIVDSVKISELGYYQVNFSESNSIGLDCFLKRYKKLLCTCHKFGGLCNICNDEVGMAAEKLRQHIKDGQWNGYSLKEKALNLIEALENQEQSTTYNSLEEFEKKYGINPMNDSNIPEKGSCGIVTGLNEVIDGLASISDELDEEENPAIKESLTTESIWRNRIDLPDGELQIVAKLANDEIVFAYSNKKSITMTKTAWVPVRQSNPTLGEHKNYASFIGNDVVKWCYLADFINDHEATKSRLARLEKLMEGK